MTGRRNTKMEPHIFGQRAAILNSRGNKACLRVDWHPIEERHDLVGTNIHILQHAVAHEAEAVKNIKVLGRQVRDKQFFY